MALGYVLVRYQEKALIYCSPAQPFFFFFATRVHTLLTFITAHLNKNIKIAWLKIEMSHINLRQNVGGEILISNYYTRRFEFRSILPILGIFRCKV